jgi:DNA-damage-inducible protein D
MDRFRIVALKSSFDSILHATESGGVEYWTARELMPCLGYRRWENFEVAIRRAMVACETSGIPVPDQFRDLTKLIALLWPFYPKRSNS